MKRTNRALSFTGRKFLTKYKEIGVRITYYPRKLIQCFKIKSFENVDANGLFTRASKVAVTGNKMKLLGRTVTLDTIEIFFTYSITDDWNHHPNESVV